MTILILINDVKTNMTKVAVELKLPKTKFIVESTTDFGDLTCNISFLLTKYLGMSPFEIAQLIVKKYKKYLNSLVINVIAHQSGHLNFFVNMTKLSELILKKSRDINYGSVNIGNNLSVNIEHTSINPNKAVHIGHVRNIIIGDTLARILKKVNYNISVLNYIDDSGLQVADLIVGFKHLGFSINPPQKKRFDQYCGDDVYVNTINEYKKFPVLLETRKKILSELENSTSKIVQFANTITKKILTDQLKTCWRLHATYDCITFESQIIHSGLWKKIFEKMKRMKLIQYEVNGKNSRCWVIKSQNENNNDKVLVRSNGTATYIAKDITYALWKLGLTIDPFNYKQYTIQYNRKILWETTLKKNHQKLNFATKKIITIIDTRQSYLQNIILDIIKKFSSESLYIHLKYESVTLSKETIVQLGIDAIKKSTQMSGRKGIYVTADFFLDSLCNEIFKKTREHNNNIDKNILFKIAENIAIGILRYELIKIDLDKSITFDYSKSLDIKGNTAIYIQYAYARASRILEKYKLEPSFNTSYNLFTSKYEFELIKLIGKFEIYVHDAAVNLAPKIIANYCYELAVAFNSFYEHINVLNINNKILTNLRICLIYSFRLTLEKALALLGIIAPEIM